MRVAIVFVVLLASAGCLDNSANDCGGGVVCPVAKVCLAGGGCAFPEQVAACDGKLDGDPCTFAGTTGKCAAGVCEPSVGCGNGIVDPGEVCDDGNTNGGDGCSADCKSTETCGNGIVDVAANEGCDDGNRRSHDGCDSACQVERPAWTEVTPGAPPGRESPAFAYDAAHGTTVMFGGDVIATGELSDTWTWDGTSWIEQHPGVSPVPGQTAMVYDAARGRIVMIVAGLVEMEVWEWNGRDWSHRLQTPTEPPLRGNFAIAYDGERKRIVLFGGTANSVELADTWEWDGTSWIDVTPADPTASPSPRSGHSMAYDPVRGRIVMFGGAGTQETWEWDGTTWTQRMPLTTSPPSLPGVMTFDAGIGHVVFYEHVTVFQWDGTDWSVVPTAVGFHPQTTSAGLAYDTSRGRLVLFGGRTATNTDSAQTLELDGMTWTTATPTAPFPCAGVAGAYDPLRARFVVFGGDAGGPSAETLEWDGRSWTQPVLTSSPPPREFHAMIYDSSRAQVVASSGLSGSGLLSDSWTYDGTTWTMSGFPVQARMRFAMAYDTDRGHLVISGGLGSLTGMAPFDEPLFDTWDVDGASVVTGPSPSAYPVGAAMVYDPALGRTVAFGGFDPTSGFLGADTTAWDGTTWTQGPPDGPPARSDHALVYDPMRDAVVMFGSGRGDTWEFDGATWIETTPGVSPPLRASFAFAFDSVAEGAVAFGGSGLGDSWVYQLRSRLPDESCLFGIDSDGDGLVGCADPDCWGYCSPLCPLGTTCDPAAPHCGDGVCSAIETCRLCPGDCGACAPVCGDFVCDPGETASSCPGDCS